MVGINTGWQDGSTALLGVNFEFEKMDTNPSLALVDCRIFIPACSLEGFGRLAVAAT